MQEKREKEKKDKMSLSKIILSFEIFSRSTDES